MTRTSECDYTHTYTHASGNIRKEHAAANNENTLQCANTTRPGAGASTVWRTNWRNLTNHAVTCVSKGLQSPHAATAKLTPADAFLRPYLRTTPSEPLP